MDFERLSSNNVALISELLKNQSLVNYIGHTGDNPNSVNISPASIAPNGAKERIFAYPFDTEYNDDVRTQLHIYYPSFELQNNGYANNVVVAFDIVVHKKIWLVSDNGEKIIRPYQIIKYIMDSLKGKDIPKLGKIHFLEGMHTTINEQFNGIRLIATFTEF